MQKDPKDRTITIKINGDEYSYTETVVSENQEKKQKPEEKEKIDGIQKEVESINQEAAAAEEKVDDSFDWILPEQSNQEIKEYKINYSTKQKKNSTILPKSLNKHRKMKWNSSLLMSIGFAILLGTSFGLLMLKLLTDNHVNKKQPGIVENEETGAKDNKNTTVSSNNKSIELAELSTFIIQAGVFSSEDSAKILQETITNKGFPSKIITAEDKFYIYVGVADSLENAKVFSSEMKDNDINVYAKEWKTASGKVGKINSEEEKLLKIVSSSYTVFVDNYSLAVIGGNMNDTLNKTIKDINGINENKLTNQTVLQLKKDLQLAGEKLNQYANNKDSKELNEAQQHLLSVLSDYQSLFQDS